MDNNNKTYFQRISNAMEDILQQYKNQYPNNYGELIRDFLPMLLITLPVFFFSFAFYSMTENTMMLGCFVAPVLFVFALFTWKNLKIERRDTQDLTPKINALKRQLDGFNEYPDVVQYAERYAQEVDNITANKKKIIKNFHTFKLVYYGVGGLLCLVLFVAGFMRDTERDTEIHNHGSNNFINILELEEDIPYLAVKPLVGKTSSDKTIETAQAEIFLTGTATETFLTIKELKIAGTNGGEKFRLLITDLDGRPIAKCPKFVFNGNKTSGIKSTQICYEEFGQNDFQAMQVLKYLQDNKDNLRFVVDEI